MIAKSMAGLIELRNKFERQNKADLITAAL